MKIRPVAAEFSHADGRTDSQKLVVAFHNFAKAPKMTKIKCILHCTYFHPIPATEIVGSNPTGGMDACPLCCVS